MIQADPQDWGWFKVQRDLIGSDLWRRPLALRAWLLILGRVNHRDGTRGDFKYPAGTWTTCFAEIADALTWKEGHRTITPTKRQARHALDLLKSQGLIKV